MWMWSEGETPVEVTEEQLKKGDVIYRSGHRMRYLGDGLYVYLDMPYILFDSPEEQRRFGDETSLRCVAVGFTRPVGNVLSEEGMRDTLRTMTSLDGRHFFHHSVKGASWPTWKESHKKRYHWYR